MSKNPDINYPLDDIRNWVKINNEDKIINKTEFRKKFNAQGTRSFTSLLKQFKRIAIIDEEFGDRPENKKKIKFEWKEEVEARDTSAYRGNTNAEGSDKHSTTRLFEYLALNVFNKHLDVSIDEVARYGYFGGLEGYINRYGNRPIVALSPKTDNYMTIKNLSIKFFGMTETNPTDVNNRTKLKRAIEQLEKKGYISIEKRYRCILSDIIDEDENGKEIYSHEEETLSDVDVGLEVYQDYCEIRKQVFDGLKAKGVLSKEYRNWHTLSLSTNEDDIKLLKDGICAEMRKHSVRYEFILNDKVINCVYEQFRFTLLHYVDIYMNTENIFKLAGKIGYMETTKKIMAFCSDDFHKYSVGYLKHYKVNLEGEYEEDKNDQTDKFTRKEKRTELMEKELYGKYNLPELDKVKVVEKINPLEPIIIPVKRRKKKFIEGNETPIN